MTRRSEVRAWHFAPELCAPCLELVAANRAQSPRPRLKLCAPCMRALELSVERFVDAVEREKTGKVRRPKALARRGRL